MYITLITIIVAVALEKIEGTIKNGESREAGNIGYRRYRSKTNKPINTTQKMKKDEQQGPHQKPRMTPSAQEGIAVPASYMLFIYSPLCANKHK